MLVVETIAKIRRAYFAQNKPIKTICRELRVSRKVVRKVIRSQATEFRYQRGRQPLPRIDPWRDQLDGLAPAIDQVALPVDLDRRQHLEALIDIALYRGRAALVLEPRVEILA